MAEENRSWGYDRIVGALANLGHEVSDQTVGNVLRRQGIAPAPERKRRTTWAEFIRIHQEQPWLARDHPRGGLGHKDAARLCLPENGANCTSESQFSAKTAEPPVSGWHRSTHN
jgi:hypothetical protein